MNNGDNLKWIMGVIGAAFTAMFGWIYKGTHARIKRVEEIVATKADGHEMERQRDNIRGLFETMSEHERYDTERFERVMEKISQNQAELLREIGKR